MKKKWHILPGLVLAVVGVFLYARYIEPNQLRVNRLVIETPKWSREHPGLRILQMSDLHLPSMSASLRGKVLRAVRDEAPEMIVITGDVLSTSSVMSQGNEPILQSELEELIRYLSQLHAPLGVWMVRGNHDMGDDKEVNDRLLHALRNAGLRVLTNQCEEILLNGQSLYLLGLDYSANDTLQVRPFIPKDENDAFFIESGPSAKNSYTHFHPRGEDKLWRDYTLSARLWVSDDRKSGAGITFYSQFHHGLDHYYRLRWSSSQPGFRFVPHNTVITHGEEDVPVRMTANTWYWCKVEVATGSHETCMAAKIWREDEVEPNAWQAVACDSSSRRLKQGTVGLWSINQGRHRFADLLVVSAQGDTLLQESWQRRGRAFKPPAWIDFHYHEAALPLLTAAIPDSSFTLLLCHSPETLDEAAAAGIDLLLSGHTHGGQIRLPFLSLLLKHLHRRFRAPAGWSTAGKTRIYVNQGLGSVYLPLRFLTPPEISVFQLQHQAEYQTLSITTVPEGR